jgi:hypothetical protein
MSDESPLPTYHDATKGQTHTEYGDEKKRHGDEKKEYEDEKKEYVDEKQKTSQDDILFPPSLVAILSEPTLVIERQLQVFQVVFGVEQAKKFKIMNSHGQQLGWMIEKTSFSKTVVRHFTGTNRPFEIQILNMDNEVLLDVKRAYVLVNSHIIVRFPRRDASGNVFYDEVGRSDQVFNVLKRKYNLSVKHNGQFQEFGRINARTLGVTFPVVNSENKVIAGVDRSWVGLYREIFAQTPIYVVRFDIGQFGDQIAELYHPPGPPLNLAQRSVMLGCAVSIDLDYFSRE